MNCEITIKNRDFKFSNVDPSIFNLICQSNLDLEELYKKFSGNINNITIDSIFKEINETNDYEISIYEANSSFAYINNLGDLVFLNKDFCEKFNLRQIIKENIFDCKDEDEIRSSITENIADIDNTPAIILSCIGKRLLHEIIETLTNIVNLDINSGEFYDYNKLLKDCEIKFYNQCAIYKLVIRIIY